MSAESRSSESSSAECTTPESLGDGRQAVAVSSPELASLGLTLLQARQALGLEANVLADRLHIGREQLEALETADLARLPEPVFVIAHARRLAGALELDLEPQLQALRESDWMRQRAKGTKPSPLRPKPAVASGQGAGVRAGAAAGAENRRDPGPALLPIAMGGLAAIAVIGAALWGLQQGQKPRRPAAPARAAVNRAIPAGAVSRAKLTDDDGLTLRSTPASWVEVRDAQGVTLFKGSLNGSRHFPHGQSWRVLAGRPDLIWVQTGPKPGRSLGSISDVRWRSLP